MKITYIEHSGFSIETDTYAIIFDYYRGKLPEFNRDNPLYVFASHKHHDHYSSAILKLYKQYPHIRYILSSDIKIRNEELKCAGITDAEAEKILKVKENQLLTVSADNKEPLTIETLASNDEGVAFVVRCGDKCFYHAGDLNWWYWEGEEETVNQRLVGMYKEQLDKIKGRRFDAAFVPLDPRQDKYFYYGLDYFMKQTDTQHVFPMHLWEDYSVIPLLSNMGCAKNYRERIMPIQEPGQVFHIQ